MFLVCNNVRGINISKSEWSNKSNFYHFLISFISAGIWIIQAQKDDNEFS